MYQKIFTNFKKKKKIGRVETETCVISSWVFPKCFVWLFVSLLVYLTSKTSGGGESISRISSVIVLFISLAPGLLLRSF